MSTIKVTNIQNASATNTAMVLDTAGTVKAYSTISVGNATPLYWQGITMFNLSTLD